MGCWKKRIESLFSGLRYPGKFGVYRGVSRDCFYLRAANKKEF